MRNVTLPTPLAVAAAGLCLLGGYLVGVVAGPGDHETATAEVESYERSGSRLCLRGDAVRDLEGTDEDGVLCGTWRRTQGAVTPRPGDEFTFVTLTSSAGGDGGGRVTYIYGDVAG
jgi:hypothetical protein